MLRVFASCWTSCSIIHPSIHLINQSIHSSVPASRLTTLLVSDFFNWMMKESSWNITFFFVPYCDSDTRTNNNNSGTARTNNNNSGTARTNNYNSDQQSITSRVCSLLTDLTHMMQTQYHHRHYHHHHHYKHNTMHR